MIHRYYAALAVMLIGVPMLLIGVPLYFYWIVREDWMVPILMSGACLTGSVVLTGLWTLWVVFPFVKTATESTAARANGTVAARVGRGTISKWTLGAGVPLLIVLLGVLSLLVYPRLFYSGGWIGALVPILLAVLLVRVLQYYSFFTDRRNEAGIDSSPQSGIS